MSSKRGDRQLVRHAPVKSDCARVRKHCDVGNYPPESRIPGARVARRAGYVPCLSPLG